MADTGKEILDSGHVSVNGQKTGALSAFGQYLEILNRYRARLAARGVDFSQLPEAKDGAYWDRQYHAEDDISIRAFRDTSQTLRTAGAGTQTQLDLIAQTENLHHHWNDPASDAALHNYLTNKDRMEQDQRDLVGHQQNIAQVAENLQKALEAKRDMAVNAIDKLVNQALRNSPGDFENRLRTACESMEANNQGGGIGGFGFHQHLYQHHGAPGKNWNANDVRGDIQNSVVNGFAIVYQALDKADNEVKTHIEENYNELLKALDAQGGPPPPLSEEALGRVMPKLAKDPQKLHEYYEMLLQTMRENGIHDPKAQIAFLATLAEESDQFTAPGLEEGWDDRYGASPPYDERAHYYQMMDGLEGDDWVYHGRGYIQLTTRANYQAAQNYLRQHGYPNIDLMGHPEQASDPKTAAAIAGWYWKNHGVDLSRVAASGDPSTAFTNVTMGVNGAPNGEVVPTAHYDVRAGYYNALVTEYREMLAARGVPESSLPTTIDTAPRY